MPTDLLGRDYETFPAPEPLQTHGPARVIAMCNQKGGVGKTTSSINIGGALSQYGRRVLIVDFDPQGAATVGLGINANAVEDTVYTALFNPRMDVHSVIHHTDCLDSRLPRLLRNNARRSVGPFAFDSSCGRPFLRYLAIASHA